MNSPKLGDKVPRAQGKRTKQQQTQQIEHSEEEVELSPVSSKYTVRYLIRRN
jgi:hypothetical protein